jgi:hypothetical protein
VTSVITPAEHALAADDARRGRAQLATGLINAGTYMRNHLDQAVPDGAAASFAAGLLTYQPPAWHDQPGMQPEARTAA